MGVSQGSPWSPSPLHEFLHKVNWNRMLHLELDIFTSSLSRMVVGHVLSFFSRCWRSAEDPEGAETRLLRQSTASLGVLHYCHFFSEPLFFMVAISRSWFAICVVVHRPTRGSFRYMSNPLNKAIVKRWRAKSQVGQIIMIVAWPTWHMILRAALERASSTESLHGFVYTVTQVFALGASVKSRK